MADAVSEYLTKICKNNGEAEKQETIEKMAADIAALKEQLAKFQNSQK